MISTIQEDTLPKKASFGRWDATSGVKINRYHDESGRFSEKPSRSAIEDSNQTIKCFGVGYHLKKTIVERKNSNYPTSI